MSSLADAIVQSDLDIAPLLLPAQVLRNDAQAIKAAHELAQVARLQAAKRDQQRKLPWSEIEQFTRSGLGSIAVPREYGGPQVSFVTLASVFAIISAADPALGQIPQNQFGILNLILGSATESQKKTAVQKACSKAGESVTRGRSAGPKKYPRTQGADHRRRRWLRHQRAEVLFHRRPVRPLGGRQGAERRRQASAGLCSSWHTGAAHRR